MPATEAAPTSATLIAGKYQLVRMIGRGGMGSVWEAKHITLGTRVAVKFIEADSANSAEARMRFDTEARAAASIQSKHAIQIYDHGLTDDGHPYIVMEMLEGETLDRRIDAAGRLPLQATAKIMLQVCRGLSRAHERGIIHRDLKPENIFLVRSHDDDEEIAKILDFGIAKIRAGEAGDLAGISSGTKTGAVLGTPYFMSPEQARGLKEVDHRTDVWSIGVIVYKCVTGELPFNGQAVGDLLVKICTSPPPIPSEHAPGLSPAFDAWFARALDRDQDRRFATVTELADGLAYAAGLPARAGRVSDIGPGHTQAIVSSASGSGSGSGLGSGSGSGSGTPPSIGASASVPPAGQSAPGGYGAPAVSNAIGSSSDGALAADNASATSAPFTTSMRTPGLPQPRPVLGTLLVLLTLAAIAGGAFLFFSHRRAEQDEAVLERQRRAAAVASASSDPSAADAAVTLADPALDAGLAALPVASSHVPYLPGGSHKPPPATSNGMPLLPPPHPNPHGNPHPHPGNVPDPGF